MYGTEHDMQWLEDYIDRDDFARIIIIDTKGLAGEILCWSDDNIGVIGFLHVAQKMRHLGIGSALVSLAAQHFEALDLRAAEISLRTKTPFIQVLLEKLGFCETKKLVLYPGMDIDPEA
jgi:Acetyltransferase (GNAT) family.